MLNWTLDPKAAIRLAMPALSADGQLWEPFGHWTPARRGRCPAMTRRWQFFPKADVELDRAPVSRHTSGCATF